MLDFVVARALKKDPAVRYQDAYEFAVDLRTCLVELRSRETAAEEGGTQRHPHAEDRRHRQRPRAARAGGANDRPDTQLSLSRQFDSFAAVQRLAAQNRRDRKLLAAPPRPVGFLRRVCRDAGPRLLFVTSLVAAAAGAWVALRLGVLEGDEPHAGGHGRVVVAVHPSRFGDSAPRIMSHMMSSTASAPASSMSSVVATFLRALSGFALELVQEPSGRTSRSCSRSACPGAGATCRRCPGPRPSGRPG